MYEKHVSYEIVEERKTCHKAAYEEAIDDTFAWVANANFSDHACNKRGSVGVAGHLWLVSLFPYTRALFLKNKKFHLYFPF